MCFHLSQVRSSHSLGLIRGSESRCCGGNLRRDIKGPPEEPVGWSYLGGGEEEVNSALEFVVVAGNKLYK